MITHLKHHQIDKEKWDKCILSDSHSFVYAFSWYLDAVSPEWEALVMNEYEAVMPLTIKKKFGCKYLVQPSFCQRLGIFSAISISEDIESEFLSFLNFKHIFISTKTGIKKSNSGFLVTENPNYILNLNETQVNLQQHYSENTKRNIKKATRNNLIIREIESKEYVRFMLKNTPKKLEKTYQQLPGIINSCEQHNSCCFFGAYSEQKLIAAACFLISPNRLINIAPTSSAEGMEKSAMFLLIDFVIKKYAQSNIILDFEGSKIDGIARFFKGFGAKTENYYYVQKRLLIHSFLVFVFKFISRK